MRNLFVSLSMMIVVAGANAATMCVPDLSTCESCTDGTYDGYSWAANCCGVQVSGYAFFQNGGIENYTYVSQDFSNFPDNLESSTSGFHGKHAFPVCVMTSPIVSKYAFIADDQDTLGDDLSIGVGLCAQHFIPLCAFKKCTSAVGYGSSTDPA